MDNNLTISTRSFVRVQDPVGGGSLRINVTDGINLPERLTVKHQKAKDSASKQMTRRSLLRIDKTVDGTDGTLPMPYLQLVVSVPEHAAVTAAHVNALLDRLVNVLAPTADGGLALGDEIFVNQEV